MTRRVCPWGRTGSLLAALVLVPGVLATGCGSAPGEVARDGTGGSQTSAAAPEPVEGPVEVPAGCPDPADQAAEVGEVDVDGDGAAERLLGGGPGCGHLLVVEDDGGLRAALEVGGSPVSEGFVAAVPRGPRLLVTRQDVPRGGYQVRVFSQDGEGLAELLDAEGNPLVPFVATDTSPPTPVALECEPGALVLTQVVPGASADVGWEVQRRTFALGGDGAAVEEQTDLAPASVPGEQLLRRYPELRGNPVLEDCRAP